METNLKVKLEYNQLCRMKILLVFIILVQLRHVSFALDLDSCRNALGMENFNIPDSALTASSSFRYGLLGPASARIRHEIGGGAWCPSSRISSSSYEYLQIDFDRLMVITQVEVQGRFGMGEGKEYAEFFFLEYQREDKGYWVRFSDYHGAERFIGNENVHEVVRRTVSPPIIGKRIRFVPYSQRLTTLCMRVEVHGCQWDDGIIAYDMPQGDHFNGDDMFDYTYDGEHKDHYLYGGLGQLTDGDESNMDIKNRNISVKGYEWVGWKNDMEQARTLELIFKFDYVRTFSDVNIYCNNHFTKNIRVFRQANIYFSIGGTFYSSSDVQYHYTRDSFLEYDRNIRIDLQQNVGKFVKLVLYFEAQWIMISEVTFTSDIATSHFTEETPAPVTTLDYTTISREDAEHPADLQVSPTTTDASIPGGSTTSPITRSDITCNGDDISVYVPMDLLPMGRSVTWRDPDCAITNNGTHYVGTVDFNHCGTTVRFNDDSVEFRNELISHSSNHHDTPANAVIDFGDGFDSVVPVECVYPRKENAMASYLPVQGQVRFFEKRMGHLDLELQQVEDQTFTVPVTQGSFPPRVHLNNNFYIKVSSNHMNRSDVGIHLDNCVATPSASPADSTFQPLIKNGCPSMPSVTVYQSPVTEARVGIRAFQFSSHPAQTVYIHCEVSVCPVTDSQCTAGCVASSRQRRAAEPGQKRTSHLLSAGPYILMAEEGSVQVATVVAGICGCIAIVATTFAVVMWRKQRELAAKTILE